MSLRGPIVFALVSSCAGVASADETFVPWAPTPVAPKVVPKEDTDHDDVRLRVGVGYFGRFDLPLGEAGERTATPQTLGMRVWFRRAVGLDLSLGFHARLGKHDGPDPSLLAVAGRASLPLALVITKHLTMFVAPTVGYGQGGVTEPAAEQLNPITGLPWTPPEAKRRGLRATAGARLGGELHLGFIGVSRLSLTASVGIDVDYLRGVTNAPPPPSSRDASPRAAESKSSTFVARTSFSDDAWSSVLGNVALLAYF